MRNLITAVLLALAASTTAHAQPGPMTSRPIRMPDGTLLQLGATEAQVLAKFKRAPDREVTLENQFGGAVGQRWIYIEPGYSGRVVTVEFAGGRVTALREERLK
ncbi:hypothetical protein [Sinimarinibacterium thermocellulolyticum]|uniref:Lipoprotein SmpA/OmlA domain-containing protein n=1 Tax=Sinimarinibacterium thermocellulolyticum TaxID=3170016 RepID=A0ABV2A9S3_9GAMM